MRTLPIKEASPALTLPPKPRAARKALGLPSGAERGQRICGAKNIPAEAPFGLAAHEDAVIAAALAILQSRLRQPGALFDSTMEVREFLTLHLAGREREAFGVIFLNAQHALIAFEVMFEGTLTQTSVYPRELVKRALELNAAAVFLAHNHPSGTAEPSRADEFLTQTIKTALQLIDVHTLDHLVVGGAACVSFAERAWMQGVSDRPNRRPATPRGAVR